MLEARGAAEAELDGLHVAWVKVADTGDLDGQLPPARAEVPARDPDSLSQTPVAQAYRELFWSLDVDPTKHRPAGEAIARRVARGNELPSVHPLVDAYNLASAVTLVPISAFDEETLEPPLEIARASGSERFAPIGEDERTLEPGRPIVRDQEGVVSLLAHRDGQRTAITEDTSRATLLACGPPVAGPTVIPEALRKVDRYTDVVGWHFQELPETVQIGSP